jgi:hypothetical protein
MPGEERARIVLIVRDEVDRSVVPLANTISKTLDKMGDQVTHINSLVQKDAVAQAKLEAVAGQLKEKCDWLTKELTAIQIKLASTRETQSGILSWKAVVGAIVLSIISIIVGVIVRGMFA